MSEKESKAPVISAHEETLILNWKAKQLNTSYGKLVAKMKRSDLAVFAAEYEAAMKEKTDRLQVEAAERKQRRGEIHYDPSFTFSTTPKSSSHAQKEK